MLGCEICDFVNELQGVLSVRDKGAGPCDIARVEHLGVGYAEVVLGVLALHVFVLGLLASLHQGQGLADYPLDIVQDQARRLVEDKSSLAIVAALPKDVALDHYNAVQGYLLVIQNHLVTDVLLNNSRGRAYTVGHLNGRCRIWFFEVLFDLLFVAAVAVGMLVVADANNL